MTHFNPDLPCVELLPARKASARGAGLSWCYRSRVLVLTNNKRADRRFHVRELTLDRAEFHGRAFTLDKLTEGSDREAESYTLLVSDKGEGFDSCECRGFLRWGHCSHLDGVRSVIGNGWMEDPAERPAEQPVTPADVDDMARHYGAG